MSKDETDTGKLVVLVDGAPLETREARALWAEFSAHMEAKQGDFDGFAKLKGWLRVAPEFRRGKAVLVVTTRAASPARPPKGRR